MLNDFIVDCIDVWRRKNGSTRLAFFSQAIGVIEYNSHIYNPLAQAVTHTCLSSVIQHIYTVHIPTGHYLITGTTGGSCGHHSFKCFTDMIQKMWKNGPIDNYENCKV